MKNRLVFTLSEFPYDNGEELFNNKLTTTHTHTNGNKYILIKLSEIYSETHMEYITLNYCEMLSEIHNSGMHSILSEIHSDMKI